MSERDKVLLQPALQIGDFWLHPLYDILLIEELKACQRDSASQRITRVGVAVKESFEFLVLPEKSRKDLLCGHSRSQRQVAAGDSFSQAEYVGKNILILSSKHFSCPAKAGDYLVSDKEQLIPEANLAQSP